MQSPEKKHTPFVEQPLTKALVVGVLVTLFVTVFFLVTRGSHISFCVFTIDGCKTVVNPPITHPPFVTEVAAVGAGAAAAAVLTAVIEAPVAVAVGVGIVIWWIVSSLLS